MEQISVVIEVLGKEYRVSCKADEKEALMASARYLNEKVREVRASGKIVGNEKIAVMAALNLANELIQLRSDERAKADAVRIRMQGLQQEIAVAIDNHSQLKM